MKTQLEASFDEYVLANPERARESVRALREELARRKVIFAGKPLPTSIKSHFVNTTLHRRWATLTERLFAILERVGEHLLRDRHLFNQLNLPAAAKELFEIAPNYSPWLAIGRPDFLWEGEHIAAVEINTDSPAMMTFADEVESVQRELLPTSGLKTLLEPQGKTRTTRLHEALMASYRAFGGTSTAPTIAIVDLHPVKTYDEQLRTAHLMTELGSPTFVCDARELRFNDGALWAQGRRIDVVYRRVLFPDFLSRPDDVAELLKAVRAGAVCMVNPLRSYLLGSKSLLSLLWDDQFMSSFPDDDRTTARALVARTLQVTTDRIKQLLGERDRWVIKPAFGHGGHDVMLGSEICAGDWSAIVNRATQSPWVMQPLLQIPQYSLPDNDGASEPHFVNWNPFVFGGKFGGSVARASQSRLVSVTARGALLPTVSVLR